MHNLKSFLTLFVCFFFSYSFRSDFQWSKRRYLKNFRKNHSWNSQLLNWRIKRLFIYVIDHGEKYFHSSQVCASWLTMSCDTTPHQPFWLLLIFRYTRRHKKPNTSWFFGSLKVKSCHMIHVHSLWYAGKRIRYKEGAKRVRSYRDSNSDCGIQSPEW